MNERKSNLSCPIALGQKQNEAITLMEAKLLVFHRQQTLLNFYRKLIPGGLTVTLLRDPVDMFESGYVYLGLQSGYKMDINEFATKFAKHNVPR